MARKKLPINPRDFNGQSDDYILGIVSEDITRADKFLVDKFNNFETYNRMYNSKLAEGEKREYGANLFIPYIYSTVETAIPKLLGSVFDSTPFISYKPVAEGDEDKAQILTDLVDYQMKKKMHAATALYDIFKSAILYGTAISKQTWKYKEKSIIKRVPTDVEVPLEDGNVQKVKRPKPIRTKKVVYDAPVLENVPVDKFRFDPAYTDVDSSPWVCQEYTMELYELQLGEKEGIYKNTKKITADTGKDESISGSMRGSMRDGVTIWEYWTDDWKVMIANKGVVVQVTPNPYFHGEKPYTKWAPVPMPNEFFGKSMVESLCDLQSELNTLRSQRIDNVSMALNRMFVINKNADIDTKQLVSRPNGFIEVDNIQEDIKELQMSDVTGSAYSDEEIVKADMDVTSGVHSYDRGQQPDRADTATVANLLTSASSERFKLQVMMMEETPMTRVGEQLAELNKQFLSDDTLIRITQEGTEEDIPVSFEDIDIDYDVIPVGTAIEPSVNKEIRQTQLIQLLNVAASIEGVDLPVLMRKIFEEFDFKDVDDMFMEQQPQMQMPVEGEQQLTPQQTNPQDTGVDGLYPQLGGVGGMAQYLQNENI